MSMIGVTPSKGGSGKTSYPAAVLFSAWVVFRYTVEERRELVDPKLLPLDDLETHVDSEGYLHRNSLPAWQSEHEKEYYSHGYVHRLDGPAKIYGTLTTRYFLYGMNVSENFHREVSRLIRDHDIPGYIAYVLAKMKETQIPKNIDELVQLPVSFALKAIGLNFPLSSDQSESFHIIAEDERVRYIATH